MEALASIRDVKRSGGKGDDEIFMNFGDIFLAGKRGKVEEQLKVSAWLYWVFCQNTACNLVCHLSHVTD